MVLDRKESTRADFYSRSDVDKLVSSGRVTPWLREGWKLMQDQIWAQVSNACDFLSSTDDFAGKFLLECVESGSQLI